MTCAEWEDLFESDFEIPDEVAIQFMEHINTCSACRQKFIEFMEFHKEESKDIREFLIRTPHDDLRSCFYRLKTDLCRRMR